MMHFLARLRYQFSSPVYFLLVALMSLSVILVFAAISLSVIDSKKLSGYAGKVTTFKEAIVWEYRAFRYDGVDKTGLLAPHSRIVGTIEGMTVEGELLVRFPHKGEFREEVYGLADIVIKNHYEAAKITSSLKLQPIYLDIYETQDGDVVVAWLSNGEPLNLLLINSDSAVPVENPPTNIVNILMAAFLWKQL